MSFIRALVALSGVLLVTACATAPTGTGSAAAKADEHASHHPAGVVSAPAPAAAPMQDRMKAMREMRDKMMNAKTPQERQALMADHMKSMQDGMQMMKGMGGGMMRDSKAAPADIAQQQQLMAARMDMMQMMMDMMMQRMPASGVAPAGK